VDWVIRSLAASSGGATDDGSADAQASAPAITAPASEAPVMAFRVPVAIAQDPGSEVSVSAVVWPIPFRAGNDPSDGFRTGLAAACQALVCSGAAPEAFAVVPGAEAGMEPPHPGAVSSETGREPGEPCSPGIIQIPVETSWMPSSVTAGTADLLVVIGIWEAPEHQVSGGFRQPGDVAIVLSPADATAESAAAARTALLGLIHEHVVRSACGGAQGGLEGALVAGGRPLSPLPVPTPLEAAADGTPAAPAASPSAPESEPGPDSVLITVSAADVGRVIRQMTILGVSTRLIGVVGPDSSPTPAEPASANTRGAGASQTGLLNGHG